MEEEGEIYAIKARSKKCNERKKTEQEASYKQLA